MCGIFGIKNHPDSAALTALGLNALQHRGQESVGITTIDSSITSSKFFGTISDNFDENTLSNHLGQTSVGHVRYSTTGQMNKRNIQPLDFDDLIIAHNGNLTNSHQIRKELIEQGELFNSTTDTETIYQLFRKAEGDLFTKIKFALSKVEGAYALILATKEYMIGVCDPHGIRPLSLGSLDGHYMLASESCAFDIVGGEHIKDIGPGEMVVIDSDDNIKTKQFLPKKDSKFCIFEYVYFSRPNSNLQGKSAYGVRKESGKILAKEHPVDADVVVPVLESGVYGALGFSEESKIPLDYGLIRNHYIGRTFIQPTSKIRHLSVKLKHSPNIDVIKGKKIVLVDDSIVRGTTSKKIVELLKNVGAKEVHMRITSPPTIGSCFYGVDTPDEGELLGHRMSLEEMMDYIGVDSLGFLSIEGLYKSLNVKMNPKNPQYCDACFTKKYPVSVEGCAKSKLQTSFSEEITDD